jgi:hypothetical protein
MRRFAIIMCVHDRAADSVAVFEGCTSYSAAASSLLIRAAC